VKHSILRSFEALIKGLDPAPEEPEAPQEPPKPAPRPKPRILVEEGVFLGRAWRRYADGGVEGETVRGMAAFRDLESFQSFVEDSPLLRSERFAEDSEEGSDEPVPVEVTQGVATRSEHVSAASVHEAAPAQATPARPHPDRRLARELMIGGALGFVACAIWWLRFYLLEDVHAELLRRGLSEGVIRSANLSVRHSLSCFFLNSDACVAVKNWGRLFGHLAYEPLFAWASIGAVALGFLLIHVQGKAKNRPIEK
jgi:hypothetical protein